ncbi:heterocyst frequency control protein PatD [Synechocystis salina LEGE 06155]|nr:heterocyst frequency control protein PatD [Synechocystis salina LEGE 06155]
MSSTLPFDLPDRLRELRQLLEQCQLTMTDPGADAAEVTSQIGALESFIQKYLLSLPAADFPPGVQQKWLSVRTELQRTLRLLSTELVFWRSARSPNRRHHYQQRLLGHYQQLMDFSGAMQQWVGAAD